MNLENAKARLPTVDRSTSPVGGGGGMPDMSALAGMFGGGGGGMPDLASFMQNPQLMQMAQSMMADGGLERMMQNPTIRNMVRMPHFFHDSQKAVTMNSGGEHEIRRQDAQHGRHDEQSRNRELVSPLFIIWWPNSIDWFSVLQVSWEVQEVRETRETRGNRHHSGQLELA